MPVNEGNEFDEFSEGLGSGPQALFERRQALLSRELGSPDNSQPEAQALLEEQPYRLDEQVGTFVRCHLADEQHGGFDLARRWAKHLGVDTVDERQYPTARYRAGQRTIGDESAAGPYWCRADKLAPPPPRPPAKHLVVEYDNPD
jgi:hypothetical protein